MTVAESASQHPRVGMLATVRNRRGILTAVDPYADDNGAVFHLVTIEYLDADGDREDQLIWEREVAPSTLKPTALPNIDALPPMVVDEYDALVRAVRWGALTPFVDPDGSDGPLTRLPIIAPVHGAIQVEDFQLVPLLKALQMPRVSLLLADDVGLGKTVEAGLILSELLNRRRIRRVMVISPASLCLQWQQEMSEKFALSFDLVNRDETHALRKRLGMDANPWRTYSRIITSYYYLKQPDVLEQFLASSRSTRGDSPHLPWDLLIVDEAHNLTPSPFGEDSDLAKMLERIAPLFEHRLFLTATPHNGHTRCFSGLLERLDPVRFSQTSELSPAERSRIEEVVVRRLKRDINARTNPPRFCRRDTVAIPLRFSPEEVALSKAFQTFRTSLRRLILTRKRGDQVAGTFALEVLGKRLLSCPVAFADSWWRCRTGLALQEQAEAEEVRAAERAASEDTGDDREAESRTAHAAHVVGAWLKPFAASLKDEMLDLDLAIEAIGLDASQGAANELTPEHDARFDALCAWVDARLRIVNGGWRDDERLVIFTEYKTTLDYLVRRLQQQYGGNDGAIRVLFGGLDLSEREAVKRAFNDPADPVRILVATDTGSEGLNLQETARYLIHYDVPWNPARLEQRNGRLDRHGQARDVQVFHFATDDDADIAFLAHVVEKVHTIREDLGSTSEVFDIAFQRRFLHGEDAGNVRGDLDRQVERARGRAAVPRTPSVDTGEEEYLRLQALKDELDLDAETLQQTLDVAMGIGVGRPRLEADDQGRSRLRHPIPAAWDDLVTDSLRLPSRIGQLGALPAMVFDPAHFLVDVGGRSVFRPLRDTVLLHLAHPMFRRALSTFARARFPGASDERVTSRWTVRRGAVPTGADALILLTVEELAVNELRESFHQWVRTWQLPVCNGALGDPLPHAPSYLLREGALAPLDGDLLRAQDVWADVWMEVQEFVALQSTDLTGRLQAALAEERVRAEKDEQARFQSRQGELSTLIQQTTLERLEREIAELRAEQQQGVLNVFAEDLLELESSIRLKEEEVQRRKAHYTALREQLDRERTRVMDYLLPNRFAMRGQAQVFPVAVEIRLPEVQ